MIFAISAGEECVADGRGRQIVLKSKVALMGWPRVEAGKTSVLELDGLRVKSDLVP